MKLLYMDLLSGDEIYVDNVGHIRSPKLWELNPKKGIGSFAYSFYLNLLSWNKKDFLEYSKIVQIPGIKVFEKHDDLSLFDVITVLELTRDLMKTVFDFFLVEDLIWDSTNRQYNTLDKEKNIVGYINKENFEEIRDMMLQANYIGVDKDESQTKIQSTKAQGMWDKAQSYLKKQAKTKDNKTYNLGNVISKLCAGHSSYNLLNIYDLTIFQLYDQFFQYGYLRSVNLNERVFSNYGGESFNIQDWLQPITNL